jgi:hypothetical protein
VQPVIRLPGPAGYHAGAAGADVLREASLRWRVRVQAVELHRHRQGIAVFRSARRVRHLNASFPLTDREWLCVGQVCDSSGSRGQHRGVLRVGGFLMSDIHAKWEARKRMQDQGFLQACKVNTLEQHANFTLR